MKKRLQIWGISYVLAGILMMLCTLTVQSQSVDERYRENLSSLSKYLNSKGFEITPFLHHSKFEIYENIAERFRNSAETKSLDIQRYKNILRFKDKTERIQQFIKDHLPHLEKAEKTYDIPKYLISAIIGIESNFGENLGIYNPFNVYVSMYVVEYRQKFARAQLVELMEFTERNNLDIWELNSSYAGAMSFAQFIPYSMNKWFVGDDIHSIQNNILSVANYLAYFKKRTGTLEKAVLRYNPSSLYTRAVLDLAEEARKGFAAGK